MTTLPDHWRTVTLADVADTALGKMLDKARPKGSIAVPYLRNVNVQWGRIDTHDVLSVDLSEDERARFALVPGDLLVCEGGDIGRAAIWHGAREYMAFQKALHRVRSRGDVDLRWLRYLLEHYALKGVLAERATGSTILHLPQEQLRHLPVPLPPLVEQRRIVAILEGHLSRLDAGSNSLTAAVKRADALKAAQLRQEFASMAAEEATLGQIARWGSGGTPRARTAKYYVDGTIPWVLSGDLHDAPLSGVNGLITEAGLSESSAKWVPAGAVLVAMYGATIGRLAITTFPVTTNQAVAHAITESSLVTPDYLFWFLRSQRRKLVAAGQGGAQPNISQTVLKGWRMPLPSIERQQDVVRTAVQLFTAAEGLESDISRLHRRHGVLRRALLAAAFSGQLT